MRSALPKNAILGKCQKVNKSVIVFNKKGKRERKCFSKHI